MPGFANAATIELEVVLAVLVGQLILVSLLTLDAVRSCILRGGEHLTIQLLWEPSDYSSQVFSLACPVDGFPLSK